VICADEFGPLNCSPGPDAWRPVAHAARLRVIYRRTRRSGACPAPCLRQVHLGQQENAKPRM
jgi:hypothetical protein